MSPTLLRPTRPTPVQQRVISWPRDPMGCWGEMIDRLPADDAVFLVDELNDASRLLLLADRVVVAAGLSGRVAADDLANRLRQLGMPVLRVRSSNDTSIEATDTVLVIADGADAPSMPGLDVDLAVRPVVIVITSADRPCAWAARADVGLWLPDLEPVAEGHPWANRPSFVNRSSACVGALARNIEARLFR